MDTAPTTQPTADPVQPVSLLTDSHGLAILTDDECETLLRTTTIGRVGFTARGETTILPVNYAFVAGSVLFRSAAGSKLHGALMGQPYSFEIDGWNVDDRTGWSVLIKGVADVVDDHWLTSMYESLGVDPWADAVPRDHWVRIRTVEMTGRRIVRTEGS